mmetsp:Transcript_31179/g.38489  ORF Transcript_31179/g.38489 Transcript_31179/m.38489 type:complete len:82 (+) Transcript_31179:370-615(+)
MERGEHGHVNDTPAFMRHQFTHDSTPRQHAYLAEADAAIQNQVLGLCSDTSGSKHRGAPNYEHSQQPAELQVVADDSNGGG